MASLARLIGRAGGPEAVSTVFDIGAHDGADSLALARRYPHITFVAVEPTHDLAEILRQKSAHLANYIVVEGAVGTAEGERLFNVYLENPYLNSLNKMNASGASAMGRTSHEPDIREVVSVRRLSSICDELELSTIDVIHIDTQGSDIDVLRSLDAGRLASIRTGAIEVTYRLRMYETSEPGTEARPLLDDLGFRVFRVDRLDPAFDLEHDYYFARRSTRRRVPGVVEEINFKSHVLASELRAGWWRYTTRPVQRARVALGLRTRLRRLNRP